MPPPNFATQFMLLNSFATLAKHADKDTANTESARMESAWLAGVLKTTAIETGKDDLSEFLSVYLKAEIDAGRPGHYISTVLNYSKPHLSDKHLSEIAFTLSDNVNNLDESEITPNLNYHPIIKDIFKDPASPLPTRLFADILKETILNHCYAEAEALASACPHYTSKIAFARRDGENYNDHTTIRDIIRESEELGADHIDKSFHIIRIFKEQLSDPAISSQLANHKFFSSCLALYRAIKLLQSPELARQTSADTLGNMISAIHTDPQLMPVTYDPGHRTMSQCKDALISKAASQFPEQIAALIASSHPDISPQHAAIALPLYLSTQAPEHLSRIFDETTAPYHSKEALNKTAILDAAHKAIANREHTSEEAALNRVWHVVSALTLNPAPVTHAARALDSLPASLTQPSPSAPAALQNATTPKAPARVSFTFAGKVVPRQPQQFAAAVAATTPATATFSTATSSTGPRPMIRTDGSQTTRSRL